MTLGTLILDALFPDACLACLAPRESRWRHEVACNACLDATPLPDTFACLACGAPSAALTPACHPESPACIEVADPAASPVGHLVTALLFEGIPRAARPLGEILAAASVSTGIPLHRTVLAPIPELTRDVQTRGCSAPQLLATAVGSHLGVPLAPHLLTATAAGGRPLFGIGTVGDTAAAQVVVLVAPRPPREREVAQLATLISEACPGARSLLMTCTT